MSISSAVGVKRPCGRQRRDEPEAVAERVVLGVGPTLRPDFGEREAVEADVRPRHHVAGVEAGHGDGHVEAPPMRAVERQEPTGDRHRRLGLAAAPPRERDVDVVANPDVPVARRAGVRGRRRGIEPGRKGRQPERPVCLERRRDRVHLRSRVAIRRVQPLELAVVEDRRHRAENINLR